MNNRKPILAVILTMFFIGLGQLYNGQLKKGLAFLIGMYLGIILIGITGIFEHFNGMLVGMVLLILLYIYFCWDAYKSAKEANPYELKGVNKWSYYIGFLALWYFLTVVGPPIIRNIVGYEAFEISTSSMEPTIQVGDKIMANRVKNEEIELGDIVTFKQVDGLTYLSRVVGLPNQKIEVRNDIVHYENNSEQWQETRSSTANKFEVQEYSSVLPNEVKFGTQRTVKISGRGFPERDISNIRNISVPADHIFLMGDYRNNSMDSRTYGAVKISSVEKKVNYVWWSESMKRLGIKLD